MQVLVATGQTQGLRPNDQNTCVEQELIWLPPRCGQSDECSCVTTFAGCASPGLTTTALVHELGGMTRTQVMRAIRAGMCSHCWPGQSKYQAAERLVNLAELFPVGTVVERGPGGSVRARRQAIAIDAA